MLHLKKLFIAAALLTIQTTHPVVILIHGTFAAGGAWSRPGGEFYSILKKQAKKYGHNLIPFTWTGGATHEDRLQGAYALAQVLLSYPKNEGKVVIGHSHAGNVIALASQLLSDPVGKIMKNTDEETMIKELTEFVNDYYEKVCNSPEEEPTKGLTPQQETIKKQWLHKNHILITANSIHALKEQIENRKITTRAMLDSDDEDNDDPYPIDRAYFLATPVNTEAYMPDMNSIEVLFNLYSKGDVIQPVFGFYDRLYPEHDRIANFRITIEDCGLFWDDPSHSEMHDPVIAQWILNIPYALKETQTCGFENYEDFHNGKIHFDENGTPFFKNDKKTNNEREAKEKSRMQKLLENIF